jgi:hypothetical protein
MIFLAPWFLLGTLAAAIPLVLHLRRSRRKNKIVFSTTAFFDEQFLRTARRAQVQDVLLMILRMALLLLLALALAQPLLHFPWMANLLGPLGGKQTVAIILDDSASMGLTDSSGQLLERAKQSALQVVDGLSAARGDRATVILAGKRDGGSKVLFDPPTADLAQVKEAIRSAELTDLGTDLPGAIQQSDQVFGVGTGKDVYVFSDFAASSLADGAGLTAGPLSALFLVSVRPRESPAANVSIDAIQYGAPRPMLGVPFTFRVMLTNSGAASKKLGLNLVIDDQVVAHRDIEVSPGRSQVTRFVHRFTAAGWHRGRVEIDPAQADANDAIPADNRRYFALAVEDQLKMLAVNGAPSELPSADELLFFRVAMNLRGGQGGDAAGDPRTITFDTIAPGALASSKLENYSLVLLANVANLVPQAVEALERFVDGGGSLLITLGDRVEPEVYNKWTGSDRLHGGLLPGKLLKKLDADAGFVAWVDESHPATTGFGTGSLGSLSSITFATRYRVEQGASDSIMQSDSGDPVLLEKRFGRGRVVLFTSTIDRDWTNMPLQPLFVPFVYRLVGYLAQPQVGSSGFFTTGQQVTLPSSVTKQENPRVATPAGLIAYPILENSAAGRSLVFSQTEHAGLYSVANTAEGDPAEKPAYVVAVNIPADESQTVYAPKETAIADAATTIWIDNPESVTTAARVGRQGYGIWDVLLVIALIVALVEPWLANRLAKLRGGDESRSLTGPMAMVVERASKPSEAA